MNVGSKSFLDWLARWEDSLPEVSLAGVVSDPARVGVVSVDMVKGFCTEGPLASPRVAGIVSTVVRLFQRVHGLGVRHFLLTQDTHDSDAVEFSAFGPHCIAGTGESEVIDELRALPFSGIFLTFPKNSTSSSIGTELDGWLEAHPEVATFVVVGDCTDLCVYQAAMHLRLRANVLGLRDVRVIVPADCVQTYDVPVETATELGILPHDGDLLHNIFLYQMALNGIEVVARRIVAWLGEQLAAAGADGFVCGLSGGVDSAAVAALAVRAVGPERVLAALMPCHSQPEDATLGQLVADTFDIPTVTVDLSGAYDALVAQFPPDLQSAGLAAANVKPRLRMITLYYLAQSRHYLVLGSGNRTELQVGYFTKWGDGGADLLPLGDLYKTQVWELARELGVPREVIERPPSAGLWPGQTDEGEMGITYRELDRVLAAIEAGDTSGIEPATLEKVRGMIAGSEHKRAMPPLFRVSE
jgi:NAD+ synthase